MSRLRASTASTTAATGWTRRPGRSSASWSLPTRRPLTRFTAKHTGWLPTRSTMSVRIPDPVGPDGRTARHEMSFAVHLLGRPRITGGSDEPIRALRWSLSEVRRGLGDGGAVDGDPVVLQLPPDAVVDVDIVAHGSWRDAVAFPGLGSELLEGLTVRGAGAFETWLLSKQRHVAAASEAILHEAALGSMTQGDFDTAIDYAVRAAAMSPYDENHQVLLIRLYRLAGDDEGAARQYAACKETFEQELGVAPSMALEEAMREPRGDDDEIASDSTIAALVEAGAAAVSAGAVSAGVQSLRTAARFADRAGAAQLSVTSRQVLGETLIHSLGGLDEEGAAMLYEVNEIGIAHGLDDAVAQARAELGYVDYLRARYDRAEVWLTEALSLADSRAVTAKATTYLGGVESDRGNYHRAAELLEDGVELSREAGKPHTGAFALALLGRVHLVRGEIGQAAERLQESIELAERDHWLAFLPWPQALLGETLLIRGDVDGAAELLDQAFARACQLGNPCWEGMAARGLALVAEARGDTARAFDILCDALSRSDRLADPYVWLGAYILDVQCGLGVKYGHEDTAEWVETMQELTSRTGMRELSVRSLFHGAALGNAGDAAAGALLVADIDNPALEARLAADVRLDTASIDGSAAGR